VSSIPQAGDIGFAHSNGIMARAIRLGERLRWGEKPSYWNHAFIVDKVWITADNDVVITIIQAEPHGVTNDKLIESVGDYILVEPQPNHSRNDILNFAREQVGSRYGFLSIVSVALDIASPNWWPAFRRRSTWICSALVAESLRYAGFLHNWGDIYTVTPAQLFKEYTH
jgi:hypothetical protein